MEANFSSAAPEKNQWESERCPGEHCYIADRKRIADDPNYQEKPVMDENRISGTTRNIGGKIEEGAGAVVGNARTQLQGKLDQASGAAQDLYGQAAEPLAKARATSTNGCGHR